MIIFGLRATHIGSMQVSNTLCDYCENAGTTNISQFGRYFHVFWIPFFPLGRKTFGECTHCKRTLAKSEFSQNLKDSFQANKSQIKRPVWHWSGLILVALLVLFFWAVGSTA